ncbi:MAG TPA: glycosyltransferase family 39 protein [Syntrophorhabdaceae bacterium]|jgi:4-amino-4-deoxy-L-arabinose transferase-like glycosyltransferase
MKWLIIALCLVCSILFLHNLHSRDFWAPDEGDFAEIARELEHDHVVPHLNNVPYGEKPPLFYYITYGSHRFLSFCRDEFSMRLPSALAALGLALFFLVTVGILVGRAEAVTATAILISAPLYYWQARYLQVDMVFAVFVACGMLSFFRFDARGERPFYYLFFIFAALAFMTKGPVSIALMFPPVFIYLLFRKDLSLFRRIDTYVGIIILIGLILPWYAAVYWKEGLPFLQENILRQNFSRFFDAWSHKRPFYYYFTTLPLDFFPWSLFLPPGIYFCLKYAKERPDCAYFLTWCGWMFLFLSLSSGKISKYMLPLLPALSMVAGYAFFTRRSAYRTVVFSLLTTLFLALGGLLFFYRPDAFVPLFPERVILGILSLILSGSLLFLLLKKGGRGVFWALFFFFVLAYGIANTSVYGKINPLKSPRAVAERIKPYLSAGAPWVYYGSIRGTYVYYVGAYAVHVDEHDTEKLRALGRTLAKFYVFTRKRDMNEVLQALPGARPLFEEKIGDTVMVFSLYERGAE